jgi:Tfp pilus assembly protein PilF
MFSRRLLVLTVLLLGPCALAQFRDPNTTGNVRVRVVFENGRRCSIAVHLVLLASAGTSPVGQTFTNDECMAQFDDVPIGSYHVVASGDGIQNTDTGLFEVDSRKTSQFLYITVKESNQSGRPAVTSDSPTVALLDLNIPKKAMKDFEKATKLIATQSWGKAEEHLQKAIAIYPQFADAYNNLAVVYARTGEREKERKALEKAVSLNDHFAPAFVNFGKLDIFTHNFPEAETFLNKAAALQPNNAETLLLLANVQLMNQHFDDAITNCHKVHSMQHGTEQLVHYIAARALEHENRLQEAVDELRTFLSEEPSGPRADAARKEMAAVKSQAPSQ